jgi:hypothetical protein
MLSIDKIIEIYCIIDDFCKELYQTMEDHSLKQDNHKRLRNRHFKLTDSEVITILLLFHLGQFRNLKHFYLFHVKQNLQKEFPDVVSYNRFVELQRKAAFPMVVFLRLFCMGKCTGISFIDSTPLRVCHSKREHSNKVFKGIAQKGKSTIGWFFGFKLHLVINDKGEILEFMLTQGNVDDREPLKNKAFHENIFGKIFGDKGYISQTLFEDLFINGIHLITKLRKNMKNCLLLMNDHIMLRKRALIECVNDQLKNICQIEHTRHRSFDNFVTNLISGLIAYSFLDKKPSINTNIFESKSLMKVA